MAGPNLGRRQAKRVHVHHRIGCSNLFLGHLPGIETRSHLALLLVGEPNENVGMLPRLDLYGFKQGWQQRRTAPVIDNAVTFGNAIEVRPDYDHFVGAAREQANDVGQLLSLHRLFGKMLVVATGFSKHLLERRLTLLVVASVFI